MRPALAKLRSSVARVSDIAKEIETQTSAAIVNPVLRRRHDITLCAATVILSGFFESFLKDVAESFVGDFCALGIPFAAVGPTMRNAHFGEGGRVLQAKAFNQPKSQWVTAPVEDIARRIGSVTLGGAYELLWEAFADTGANPKASVVKEFIARFGVKNVWPKIASKTRNTENTLISALDSFMAVRNECAHTGSSVTTPSARDVRGFCVLLVGLGRAIVLVLEDHLATLNTQPATTMPASATSGTSIVAAPQNTTSAAPSLPGVHAVAPTAVPIPAAPTSVPTAAPTSVPTAVLTSVPTSVPSAAPTAASTSLPIPTPVTVAPSGLSTAGVSAAPGPAIATAGDANDKKPRDHDPS
jgi:RiboL-PSP-HEPN